MNNWEDASARGRCVGCRRVARELTRAGRADVLLWDRTPDSPSDTIHGYDDRANIKPSELEQTMERMVLSLADAVGPDAFSARRVGTAQLARMARRRTSQPLCHRFAQELAFLPAREPLLYVCHPVAPYGAPADPHPDGYVFAYGISSNIANARAWLAWLRASLVPQRVLLGLPGDARFFAPWIDEVEHGDDSDPEVRAAGLALDCAITERCDAVVLVGGRISSGMRQEAEACGAAHDLTALGREPPP